jgi:hypothetical protein
MKKYILSLCLLIPALSNANGSVESITISSPKGNLFFRLANP